MWGWGAVQDDILIILGSLKSVPTELLVEFAIS